MAFQNARPVLQPRQHGARVRAPHSLAHAWPVPVFCVRRPSGTDWYLVVVSTCMVLRVLTEVFYMGTGICIALCPQSIPHLALTSGTLSDLLKTEMAESPHTSHPVLLLLARPEDASPCSGGPRGSVTCGCHSPGSISVLTQPPPPCASNRPLPVSPVDAALRRGRTQVVWLVSVQPPHTCEDPVLQARPHSQVQGWAGCEHTLGPPLGPLQWPTWSWAERESSALRCPVSTRQQGQGEDGRAVPGTPGRGRDGRPRGR